MDSNTPALSVGQYVFGPTQAKMSSEKGQKHIYAQEHQLYYYYNDFRGHSEKESKTVQ